MPRPVASDERGRLAKLLDWIRGRLPAEHTIESLAAQASMSTRTLQREFKAATGLFPLRLDRAGANRARQKSCWKAGASPPQRIAERVGMGSAESLRHHFRAQVGATPAQYRARFSHRARVVGCVFPKARIPNATAVSLFWDFGSAAGWGPRPIILASGPTDLERMTQDDFESLVRRLEQEAAANPAGLS